MLAPIAVVGLGQLGTLFAEGFLRLGHPVFPRRRTDDLSELEAIEPKLVLVAVGEDDLAPVLERLPKKLLARVALLQNELRPIQWQSRGVRDPSVAVVWFERKNGKPPSVVLPTRLFGPERELLERALAPFDVRAEPFDSSELAHELCLKNLYILGLNLTGLGSQKKARELLEPDRTLFDDVITDVLAVERALFGASVQLDEARLRRELDQALWADAEHAAAGRSAKARLTRTLAHARSASVSVPTLERLAEIHSK